MTERLTVEFDIMDNDEAAWLWAATGRENPDGLHGLKPRILSWEPVFRDHADMTDLLELLADDTRVQAAMEDLRDADDTPHNVKALIDGYL